MGTRLTRAGDEPGTFFRDPLGQGLGGFGVNGRAVYKQLALDMALERRVDDFVDGLVVADAGKDDVGGLDGFVDGADGSRLAGRKLGREVIGALLGAVEDEQRLIEVALFHQVLAHALDACQREALGGGVLGVVLTLPMLPRPIQAI